VAKNMVSAPGQPKTPNWSGAKVTQQKKVQLQFATLSVAFRLAAQEWLDVLLSPPYQLFVS